MVVNFWASWKLYTLQILQGILLGWFTACSKILTFLTTIVWRNIPHAKQESWRIFFLGLNIFYVYSDQMCI